jgi:hypothetical protein
MGVRPDAPTIETIVTENFYEIINQGGCTFFPNR